MCVDGCAQGSGTVWRHGGVDDRPDKAITLILPEDGSAEDGGSDFPSVWSGVRSGFAGPV